MTDYADLATLKESLGVTDADRDALLAQALSAASRSIDKACGRRFDLDATASARTYRPGGLMVSVDGGGQALLVDDIGDTAGLLVEVGAGGSWTALGGVETGPDNALVRGRPVTSLFYPGVWPVGGASRVRVTARWGWPAVPEEIVQATLIQASRLYKRKDSPEGVMGSAEWGVVRLSRRDPDVWALIEHYMAPGFG